MKRGLYIHIPFCKSKCRYCDFNSYSNKNELQDVYFAAMKKELKSYFDRFGVIKIDTVFIGGGTPSFVDSMKIFDILEIVFRDFDIDTSDVEITIESNPGTITREKLMDYKLAGVNRISFGVQALQQNILDKLGRIHTTEDFFNGVKLALENGFVNINADLIFGIAGQTLDDWKESVNKILELGVPHISCYSLKVEKGTPLQIAVAAGIEQGNCSDKLDREMYYYAKDTLKAAGYIHYEISNFAKPGYECKHNKIYWDQDEYIGIGAGAHSFYRGRRYSNVEDIEKYCRNIDANDAVVNQIKVLDENGVNELDVSTLTYSNNEFSESKAMTDEEKMLEYVMLGLRKTEGIRWANFQYRFSKNACELYADKISLLKTKGLIEVDDVGMRLTDKGLDLANQAFMEFV